MEREDSQLIFTNGGSFLPGSIENVIESDDPPGHYRNSFLAQAMVNLNMIDTIGSGIKRMFRLQREKYFPLPDYDFSGKKVKASLTGKVLDMDFARVPARNPKLSLEEIIMLDKVQKRKPVTGNELKELREKGLVEGKRPNIIISGNVAVTIGQKAAYIRNKAFNTNQYEDWILRGLQMVDSFSRKDIEELLWDKLSDLLNPQQKKIKINNILAKLRKKGKIENLGNDSKPKWVLKKSEELEQPEI